MDNNYITLTCILQNLQHENNFNKIRGIIEIVCFSTALNKIFHIAHVYSTQDKIISEFTKMTQFNSKMLYQVKSSHLYLYSAFNNTNCDKATAQYQNGKIVSIM